MKCEVCGHEGPVYMIPQSQKFEQWVCKWCLDERTQYVDRGEEGIICENCGEAVTDAYVEAGGEVWCMKCIEETREYEATY